MGTSASGLGWKARDWKASGWKGHAQIVLLVLAGLYLLYALVVGLILPGWAKDKVEQTVSERLGRDVSVEEVSLNPFTVAITVNQLSIEDPSTEQLLSFRRLYLNASPWASLFQWRPWVSDLELDGLEVRLRRGASGELNTDDILDHLAEQGDQDQNEEPEQIPAFTIARVRLKEGSLALTDAGGEEPHTVSLPVDFVIEDLTTREGDEDDNVYEIAMAGPDGGELDWRGGFGFDPLSVSGDLRVSEVDLPDFSRLLEPHFPFRLSSGQLALEARYGYRDGEGLTVENGSLRLEGLRIHDGEAETPSLGGERAELSGFRLDTAGREAAADRIDLQAPVLRAILKEDGLDLASLFLPGEPERAERARERVKERARETADKVNRGDNDWRVTVSEFNVEDGQLGFRDETLAEPAELSLDQGELALRDFEFSDTVSWRWEGSGRLGEGARVEHSGEGSAAPLEVNAELDIEGLPLADYSPWLEPASGLVFDQGRADGDLTLTVRGEAPDIALDGRLRIADGALTVDGEPFLSAASLGADGFRLETGERLVSIDGLAGRAVAFSHRLDEQGNSTFSRLGGEDGGDDDGEPWRIRLGRVSVEDSRVNHRDLSLSPPYEISVDEVQGTLDSFDTGGGDAELDLQGRVEDGARLQLAGTLAMQPLAMDFEGSLKGYGMEALTPYTGRYLGYQVERGRLDLDSQLRIKDNRLDSSADLLAEKFYLGDSVDSDQKVDAPVRLGLSVLRDGSGAVRLPLDLSGDLSDPDFSAGNLVFRVIRNVLVKAATSPFSMLASLTGGDDRDYVPFTPGDDRANGETRDVVERLAGLIEDRPELALVLTGHANSEDRDALGTDDAEQLGELAEERARQVRDLLVDEHELDSSRVRVGDPETDGEVAGVRLSAEGD